MKASYKINNPAINPKRVFILQKSEVEKRFDPFFYSPLNRLKILEKTNLPKKKLSEVADLKRGKFSHRPRNDERFFGGEYPFIQTGEIVKASNNYGKIQFSQTLNELGLSVSKLFDKDVLLITIAANIGDTAILDYPACFPDSIVAISSKDENVSLKYLNVYFKFLKKYLENLAPSAAQKNLTLEQLAPTPVILPTIENQNKIVEIFDTFISQKQTNKAEAEKLLASIDDYLLGELGITLPIQNAYYLQEEDNSFIVSEPEELYGNYRFIKEKYELNQQNKLVQNGRIFISNFSEITSSRFDPDYHKSFYKQFYKNLNSGIFNNIKLKKILTKIYTGKGMYDYLPNGIPYLNVNNIKKYEVVLDNIKYLEKENQYENIISKNQIITGRVGTIGNFAKYDNTFDALISDNVFALSFNETIINIDFANYFLNSIFSFTQLKRNSRGAVQEVISTSVLNEISIPVPPLTKQKEIAVHITNIRNQAQALKDKTNHLLKKASEAIEEILLN